VFVISRITIGNPVISPITIKAILIPAFGIKNAIKIEKIDKPKKSSIWMELRECRFLRYTQLQEKDIQKECQKNEKEYNLDNYFQGCLWFGRFLI